MNIVSCRFNRIARLCSRKCAPSLRVNGSWPKINRCLTVRNSASNGIDDSILLAAKDPVVNDLAEKILNAERELAELFEPGKLMPPVGYVRDVRGTQHAWLHF